MLSYLPVSLIIETVVISRIAPDRELQDETFKNELNRK